MEDRIVMDPAICGGKPVVRGTRIMVRNILGLVAAGESVQDIVRQFPELSDADVVAALEFAADTVDRKYRKVSA